MKISTLFEFFFVLIILAGLVDLANCRNIQHGADEGAEVQTRRAKYESFFSKCRTSAAPYQVETEANERKALHVVSRRLVPDGPNPLHN